MRPLYVPYATETGEFISEVHYFEDINSQLLQQISFECREVEHGGIDLALDQLILDTTERLNSMKPKVQDIIKRGQVGSKLDALVKDDGNKFSQEELDWIKERMSSGDMVEELKKSKIADLKAMGEALKGQSMKVIDKTYEVLPRWYDKLIKDVENKTQESALVVGDTFTVNKNTLEEHPEEVGAFEKLNNVKIKVWTDLIPVVDKIRAFRLKFLDFDGRREYDYLYGFFLSVSDTSPVEFSVMTEEYNRNLSKT